MYAAYLFAIINPVLPELGKGEGEPIAGKVISGIVGILFIVGAVMAFLHLVFGAIAWISASGDKTKLQTAQERITHAIVGLIMLASAWAVMMLMGKFVGLSFPNLPLPTLF